MLAKSVASLDLITGGRAELGLGAGAFWGPVEAMGGPRRSPGEAVTALSEAIDVIRLWWSAERSVSYQGNTYFLRDAHPGPRPAHDIGIWLGAYGPRMLNLVGAKADGWLPSLGYLPPAQLTEANERIDESARAAGREPAAINRVYNVFGDFEARQWIEMLVEWTIEGGMNGFVFGGPASERAMHTIAAEIAPAVRDAVAKERRSRRSN